MVFIPVLSAQDQSALASWQLGDLLLTETPTTGSVNRTAIVHTVGGSYAFRAYFRPDKARVFAEHAALRHGDTHNIPVCLPINLPSGETVAEHGNVLYALFALASGRQIERGDLSLSQIAASGCCLARLHLAFDDFPAAQIRPIKFAFDTSETLARLAVLETIVASKDEEPTLKRLAEQRRCLEETAAQDEAMATRFAALPCQAVHGDFQQTNLFFQGKEVSAVIDWDQFGAAPRVWDILRALHLMLALAPEPCHVFLEGYRSQSPLPEDELAEGAACYGFLADRNLWVYEEFYQNGNERVRPFLETDRFRPFAERWQKTQMLQEPH